MQESLWRRHLEPVLMRAHHAIFAQVGAVGADFFSPAKAQGGLVWVGFISVFLGLVLLASGHHEV